METGVAVVVAHMSHVETRRHGHRAEVAALAPDPGRQVHHLSVQILRAERDLCLRHPDSLVRKLGKYLGREGVLYLRHLAEIHPELDLTARVRLSGDARRTGRAVEDDFDAEVRHSQLPLGWRVQGEWMLTSVAADSGLDVSAFLVVAGRKEAARLARVADAFADIDASIAEAESEAASLAWPPDAAIDPAEVARIQAEISAARARSAARRRGATA
jgi:hypothetical protein